MAGRAPEIVVFVYNSHEHCALRGTHGGSMTKVLIIEDDKDLLNTLSEYLSWESYDVESAQDGTMGLDLLLSFAYDVVVLDWTLPQMQGIEVLKAFRNAGGRTPVIMLTAKANLAEKEAGLDTGADDYLTKPFHVRELSARLRALLRRPRSSLTGNEIEVGDLVIDTVQRRLRKGNKEIHLLPRDFALLEFFMRHPNELFSSDTLLERVWQSDANVSAESVRSSLKRIRKAIDDIDCTIIENVPKVGYRMRNPTKT